MLEQAIQKKIISYLESIGWYVVKVIQANRRGVPDIIACDSKGTFWGIEVKRKGNKPTKLQLYNLDQINFRGGKSMVAYSVEEVKKEVTKYDSTS